MTGQRRYIVMPAEGWLSPELRSLQRPRTVDAVAAASKRRAVHLAFLAAAPDLAPGPAEPFRVLASTHANGPKLLEMSPAMARYLNRESPTLWVEPSVPVAPAVRPATRVRRPEQWSREGDGSRRLRVRVEGEDGRPLKGARVIALAESRGMKGEARRTRTSGSASFNLPSDVSRLPELIVEPPPGWIGETRTRLSLAGDVAVRLRPATPDAYVDALRRRIGALAADAGRGVRVAIIDSGVDNTHPDLGHVTCRSVVDQDHAAVAHHHATHVAGIVGGRGGVGGMRGVAPAAELSSLRVVPLSSWKAESFYLGEAIEQAALADVHLINVSMTTSRPSAFLSKAAAVAYQHGAVCIAAAGNEGRDAIGFPAASKRVLAVTAYGDRDGLPVDSSDLKDLTDELAQGAAHLSRARFSNWGPETDFIGPGVGIISCAPGGSYAVESGTSMAAPAVTGAAASILSTLRPDILRMAPDTRRSAAILGVLAAAAEPLGFEFEVEGNGAIRTS